MEIFLRIELHNPYAPTMLILIASKTGKYSVNLSCKTGAKMQPTFIDLFAGAGLFSAGMIKAGFAPRMAVELSQDAAASYRRNVADCIVNDSVDAAIRIPRPSAGTLLCTPS